MVDRHPRSWKNLPEPRPAISDDLLNWFHEYGRDYSWRHTLDPFHILCVELMLQRTRADQVEPVFKTVKERIASPRMP